MAILRVLPRLWIPLVVLVVIACGAFVVSRVHGIFGAEKRPSYADGQIHDTKSFNPKQVVYEVFGPAGTVADISYFDVNSAAAASRSSKLAVVIEDYDGLAIGRG